MPEEMGPGGSGITALLTRPSTVPGAARAEPTTTLPVLDQSSPPQRPRKLGSVAGGGARNVIGAAVTALSVSLLLFGRIGSLSGIVGFVVVTYLLFVGAYAALVSLDDDKEVVRDRLMTVMVSSAALLLCTALIFVIGFIFLRGRQAIFHSNFFTQDLRRTGPRQALNVGGIKHAIIGTLIMITIALSITVPLGLTTAVYLNEVSGRFARFIRTIVEAMTALPSIIAGLFIFATWILILHGQKAGLAGALALSVDMLPIIIRAADVTLRLVPGNLREASAALGAPSWRSVWHVVLPTARSGLATSVILGTARGIGETAPVLLTVGYTKATNTDPVHGPMVSLPLAAFELVRSGEPNLQARGFAAATFLLILVLVLFLIARMVGGRGAGNLSTSQQHRARRASAKDANRIIARYHQRNGTTPRSSTDDSSGSDG